MNILIIGNGFDLAHGLPTKYEHFLKYVDAFKRFKDICKQGSVKADWETANEEDKRFILHFANLYEQKLKIFEEIETLISNNVWIDYFWKIYKSRGIAGKDGWIDFESEISRWLARFAYINPLSPASPRSPGRAAHPDRRRTGCRRPEKPQK